jgi:hypothetical protein
VRKAVFCSWTPGGHCVYKSRVVPSLEQPGWTIRSLEDSPDALDAFKSEGSRATTPTPAPAIAVSPERPPVSLATLRAAGMVFDGDDAVAIGQALCRAFIRGQLLRRIGADAAATSDSSPVSPDTVFLEATGVVSVTPDDLREAPAVIQSLGKILSDIVPADTHAFLKTKIISKALASPPQFGTVAELSQALSAYERPNGTELLQGVYALWETHRGPGIPAPTPMVSDTTPPKAMPKPESKSNAEPVPTAEAKPKPQSKRRAARYYPVAVAGAVVAAIGIGLTGWFLLIRSDAAMRTVTAERDVPKPGTSEVDAGIAAAVTPPAVPRPEVAAARPGAARTPRPAVSVSPVTRAAGRPPSGPVQQRAAPPML